MRTGEVGRAAVAGPSRRQVLGLTAVLGVSTLSALSALSAAGTGPDSASATSAPATSAPATSEAVTLLQDVRLLHDVAAAEALSPVMAARLLAYGAIAMSVAAEGPDAVSRVLATSPGSLPRLPDDVDGGVATAAAFSVLLPGLLGPDARAGRARADVAVRLRLRSAPTGSRQRTSERYGRELGRAIAAWAARDGTRGTLRQPYVAPVAAGAWTAASGGPGPTDVWVSRVARPLAVPCTSMPVPRPLPFDLSVGSPYRAQLEDLVALTSRLGPEQRDVARFWEAPRGRTATPAGMWHLLAGEETVRREPQGTSARTVVALLDIAVYDALLRCWHVKFSTGCARPDQVVPRTRPDRARWRPLLPTPPFPEYTSGHSTASGAAAEVLQALLGAPEGGVSVASVDAGAQAPHRARWFPGWAEAAQEASLSRQLGGIHYRQACDDGLREGAQVARAVLARAGWDHA